MNLTVLGRIGKDAEVRDVNGQKAIGFSLAHSSTYKDKNGVKHEKTTWIDCTIWRKESTLAQYIRKGGLLVVSGMPTARAYKNKDGVAVGVLNLKVDNLTFVPTGKAKETDATPAAPSQEFHSANDLPF